MRDQIGSYFDSAHALLAWAYEDLTELQNGVVAFFDKNRLREVTEYDPESGYFAHKVQLVGAMPDRWSKLASHALNDIRHSIDQSMFAACSALSDAPVEHDVYFPWARSPTDLEWHLRNPKRAIPTALHEPLRLCHPYPTGDGYSGGDDRVFHVRNLAGVNKHRLALTPSAGLSSYEFKGTISGDFRLPYRPWNPAKNELTIALIEPGSERDYTVKTGFCVAFGDVGELSGMPVLTVLGHFGDYGQFIAEQLETAVRKALA